jgi:hypothetical protein
MTHNAGYAALVDIDWADTKHDFCLRATGADQAEYGVIEQPSPRHPLLWWGVNSTLFGKHPLDQHPEPHGA